MPRYDYYCPECGETVEMTQLMSETGNLIRCTCGVKMNRDFQAEGVRVGAGRRSYHKPIVSDSLAIHPEQIPEHRRMFPDIKVHSDGRPEFDNFADHDAYLKKCGFEKAPQKKKKRGVRIS